MNASFKTASPWGIGVKVWALTGLKVRRRLVFFVGLIATTLLAGCVSWHPPSELRPSPAAVKTKIERLLPSNMSDRNGWAQDIDTAFSAQDIKPSTDNLCSVIAVTGQESAFDAHPKVPDLADIARREINRRAAAAHVPHFLVDAALGLTSSNGQTYRQRLAHAQTERQLSDLFEDFLGQVPLGQTLFGSFNPVHTGGPMQVDVDFAKNHDDDYPYAVTGSIRHEVFTRRGGLYFGILHLLGYRPHYPSPLYRFADYNAGWFASRNAAFQHAVSRLTGLKLAFDGDLIIHGSSATGQTERATRTLADRIDRDDNDIHRALRKGESPDLSDTDVYQRVFALADQQAGKRVPRAVLPGIKLESPKITRDLTTAWFAKRVESRWQACRRRDKDYAGL